MVPASVMAPEVPVTLMTYVPGVVPAFPPPPTLPPPPPQFNAPPAREKSKITFKSALHRLRRLAGMPTSRMHAKAVLLNHGQADPLSRRRADVAGVVFTLRVVVCGEEPLRVTEAGMLQVAGSLAALGVIAQLRLIAPVNPPADVKVTVEVLPMVAPGATLSAVPVIVKLCSV
jgi:hypothetical protein